MQGSFVTSSLDTLQNLYYIVVSSSFDEDLLNDMCLSTFMLYESRSGDGMKADLSNIAIRNPPIFVECLLFSVGSKIHSFG